VLTEKNAFIFIADPYKIFDEFDVLEDRILFPPQHQSDEIVLLVQLLVALIFIVGANHNGVFCFGRGLLFTKFGCLSLVLP
jgi:hypothetical protein